MSKEEDAVFDSIFLQQFRREEHHSLQTALKEVVHLSSLERLASHIDDVFGVYSVAMLSLSEAWARLMDYDLKLAEAKKELLESHLEILEDRHPIVAYHPQLKFHTDPFVAPPHRELRPLLAHRFSALLRVLIAVRDDRDKEFLRYAKSLAEKVPAMEGFYENGLSFLEYVRVPMAVLETRDLIKDFDSVILSVRPIDAVASNVVVVAAEVAASEFKEKLTSLFDEVAELRMNLSQSIDQSNQNQVGWAHILWNQGPVLVPGFARRSKYCDLKSMLGFTDIWKEESSFDSSFMQQFLDTEHDRIQSALKEAVLLTSLERLSLIDDIHSASKLCSAAALALCGAWDSLLFAEQELEKFEQEEHVEVHVEEHLDDSLRRAVGLRVADEIGYRTSFITEIRKNAERATLLRRALSHPEEAELLLSEFDSLVEASKADAAVVMLRNNLEAFLAEVKELRMQSVPEEFRNFIAREWLLRLLAHSVC